MNILQINNFAYLRGGSERYFLDISSYLRSRAHNVIGVSTTPPKEKVDHTFSFDSFYSIPPFSTTDPRVRDIFRIFYSLDAAKAVANALEENSIDIAHLHIFYGQFTCSVLDALKKYGIPIVQTLHEYKIFCPVSNFYREGKVCEACKGRRFWKCAVHQCNRGSLARSIGSAIETYVSHFLGWVEKVNHFIAVSRFQRDKLVEYGIPPGKISVVYNFVRDEWFHENPNIGEYFLYYGRIEELKGIKTLLQAMKETPSAQLLVVGSGSKNYDSYAKKLKLWNVKFLGPKYGDELHALIDGAICTIVPSEWYETFGLVIAESFARSRPVIVSDMGGMPELVSNGVDGFIFSAGDVDSLRDRLRWMNKHRKFAAEMGRRGYQKARTMFSQDKHYGQLMEIYERVLR